MIFVQLPTPDPLKILKEELKGYESYEQKQKHEHVIANFLRTLLKEIENQK